ncbi:MAG: hexosaminidase [Candidatus Eremiobacteraeota bacterium]|nr:hexosaminidase [Candidatus Eremiobacteraeota bacterium]
MALDNTHGMWAVLRAVVNGGASAALAAGFAGALLAGCASPHANAPGRSRPTAAPATAGPSAAVPVVPHPRYARVGSGLYLWPPRAHIALRGLGEGIVARDLRSVLAANGVRVTLPAPDRAHAPANITLEVARVPDARLGDEGYELRVDRRGVTMRANTEHGLFYALRTLEQLSSRSASGFTSQAVTVVDRPEYRWRGIHLDVARHFFPVPVVERYIDLAAHYKLNTFHWHLTDDQAWRLRSHRYLALGAGRESYSEADVREVVAYAARRYVTVVPEIDLPAHADAALRAYPNLACAHGTLCTTGAGLAFARGVLGDAAALFPSLYVHTGGDEVPSPALAAQPRFTNDLEGYLRARGRRLVGWDEILTPRLSPRAVVMVWTSRKRAAEAVRHGNDVVLASGALYFDAAQGDAAQEPRASAHMSTLEQVYDYVVMPSGLSAREARHVLGAQANLWTEHVATPERLFAMALPRELALAEVLWTPRERKSWGSFLARLPAQLAWLDAHGYPFRIPNASFALSGGPARFKAVPGHVQAVRTWTAAPSLTVTLSVPLGGAAIRYTTDGSAPSAASRLYRGPFTVALGAAPVRLRAAAFYHGRAGAVSECAIARTSRFSLRAHRNASASWSALVSP